MRKAKGLKKEIGLTIALIMVVAVGYSLSRYISAGDKNFTKINVYEIQGMKVEILEEGAGEAVKNGDTVSVHYTGILENGEKFDSSLDRGTPFSFILGEGRVIKGWELGVLGMKKGEKRRLTIPYELAYGENGIPGVIPPKAILIFDVELLQINQ
jgi:FKBP-type peptidyl-prolyl cis-trans isomerase